MKRLLTGLILLALGGCQQTYVYKPFLPNAENIDVANAKCQMMSHSVEQQVVAFGSPVYVASAQLANAAGNAGRVDEFMQQCMTAQGWKREAVQNNPKPTPEKLPFSRETMVNVLATERLAAPCGQKLLPAGTAFFATVRRIGGNGVASDAYFKSTKMLDAMKKEPSTKEHLCKEAVAAMKEQGFV